MRSVLKNALAGALLFNVAVCGIALTASVAPTQLHNIPASAFRGGTLSRGRLPLNEPEIKGDNRIRAQQQEKPEGGGSKDIPQIVVSQIDATYLYAAQPAWRNVRAKILGVREADQEQMYGRVQQLLSTIKDSELNLLSPAEIKVLRRETAGEILGIGILDFAVDFAPASKDSRLVTPLIGSPAALKGLRPKDVIVAINGKRTSEMDHQSVLNDLHGPGPTKLLMRRGRQRFAVTLIPSTEPLKPVSFKAVHTAAGIVGVIRIAQFTPDTAEIARDAFNKIEREQPLGYILDLRNNPGGLLDQATKIAGLFLSGDLGSKVRRTGKIEPIRVDDAPATQAPLVVLVNEGSASAAEFVAGALQARHRATLIGARTFGRGQAQVLQSLPGGYGLVIPSALLRTPNGSVLKGVGLLPNKLVRSESMVRAEIDITQDAQLRKAIAVISQRIQQQDRGSK